MRPDVRDTDYFAPGRVNLIGEHTDYNAGLALPFAVEYGVTVRTTTLDGDGFEITSPGFGAWRRGAPATQPWARQAAAVSSALGARGLRLEVTSSLPTGAGLSSSAAYLCALALACGADGDALELATWLNDREVESGNDVGLLDPLAVLASHAGHGLLIDFADGSCRHVAIPDTFGFTVVHSGVSRVLADTAYVSRRDECRRIRDLVAHWPPVDQDVDAVRDDTLRARVRHIVTENDRVREAVVALDAHDVTALGRLVSASHVSLREDFASSTPEVDELVDQCTAEPGVFGARLIGGGFGGCVLVLHEPGVTVRSGSGPRWRVHPSDGALALAG